MADRYILSFDLGTSGIKAVLVAPDGSVGGMETFDYKLIQPQRDWAEQDPMDYWNGACETTRKLMQSPGITPDSIMGIVFATQWKGVIPLDEDGNILHNSIIWMDRRDQEQVDRLSELSGVKLVANDYWPRVMWFAENCPELFARTKVITDANGFLKFKACGKLAIDMSEHFAKSVRPKSQEFFDRLFALAKIDSSLFPELVRPSDKVGELTSDAAVEMGLKPGIPVFGGMCDIPAVTIGSGAGNIGGAHMYLGTSGWLGATLPIDDCKGLAPIMFTDDRFIGLCGITGMCAAKDYAIRTFYGKPDYALVESEIQTVPAGSEGLMCISSFIAEVAAPINRQVRGCFLGITSLHERKHFVNATMEAICLFMRARKELLEKSNGVKLEYLNAVGGGTLSAHWMQMYADVFGIEIRIPESPKYAGAVGAAYAAMIGLGMRNDYDDLAKNVKIIKTYTPDPSNVAFYDSLYAKWNSVLEVLKGKV